MNTGVQSTTIARRENRIMWLAAALLVSSVLFVNTSARAAGPSDSSACQPSNLAKTAQEHRDRAGRYLAQAAKYRQEADAHRKMFSDYSKTVAQNPKSSVENPYIKQMRLHCEKYIKDAEDSAREAWEMARFHQMQAKELEEK